MQTGTWKKLLDSKILDAKSTKLIRGLYQHAQSLEKVCFNEAPFEEKLTVKGHTLDITEFMEIKDVVKDILPRLTNENFQHIEYSIDDQNKSKEAMLKWLLEFLKAVDDINSFF